MAYLLLIVSVALAWHWWATRNREEELQEQLRKLKRELGRLDASFESFRQEYYLRLAKAGSEAVEQSVPAAPTEVTTDSTGSQLPTLPVPEQPSRSAYGFLSQAAGADLLSPFSGTARPAMRAPNTPAVAPPVAQSAEAPIAEPPQPPEIAQSPVIVPSAPVQSVFSDPLTTVAAEQTVTDQARKEPWPTAARVPTLKTADTDQDSSDVDLGEVTGLSFWTDLEKRLGGGLLNKIGVGVLVIGFSLLLGYTFQYLGPAGKIGIGYLVSALLVGGGVWLERKPVYSLYAKGLIGGGWALAYFTTYALHFLPAVRLVESEWLGLILLLAAAAGMIAHSLKYRSPVVTGLAYALGFATILLSHATLFSLTATLLLSASLVVICLRLGWFHLLVAAPLAAFGCHLVWLYPRVQAAKFAGQPLEHGFWSAALIAAYWALFLVPNYFGRGRDSDGRPQLRLLLNLINVGCFLGLLAYQSQYPEYRFGFFLTVGAVYIGLAALSRRRSDLLTMRLFVTLGAGLLIAAIPTRLTGNWVAYLWLIEAEALLVSGFLLGDWYLRLLAAAAFALLLGRLAIVDTQDATSFTLAGARVCNSMIAFGVAACAFYFNHYWLYRRFRARISDFEWNASRVFSYAAACLAVAAVYLEKPTVLLAVAWCVLAVGLVEIGLLRRDPDLRTQGYFVILLAVGRLAQFNFSLDRDIWFVTQRFWTVALVAGLLYFVSAQVGRAYRKQAVDDGDETVRRVLLHIASALASVLVWFEVPPALIGPAWGAMALVLLELGKWRDSRDLRLQGYLITLAGLGRLFQFNYGLGQDWHGLSIRLWTVGLFATLLYYLAWRRGAWGRRPLAGNDMPAWEAGLAWERGRPARLDRGVSPRFTSELSDTWEEIPPRAMLYFGSLLIGILLWFELPLVLIAPAWAVMALVLFELGRWRQSWDFRIQGHVILVFGLIRLVRFNYGAETPWLTLCLRLWTVSLFAAVLYYLYWRLRNADPALSEIEEIARRLMLHAGSALLAVLLWYELPALALAPAFGFAAILLLELGLRYRNLDLRAQSYATALLAFTRFVTVNLLAEQAWNGTSLRVLSGGLVLGHILYLFFVLRSRSTSGARSTAGQLHRYESRSPEILSTLAVAGVAALLRFEPAPAWVAASWGALAVVCLFSGIAWRDLHFRFLGLVVAVATIVRTCFTNFTAPVAGPDSLAATGVAVFSLFCCYGLLLWQRERESATERQTGVRPHRFQKYMLPACLFAATALMLVLTYQRAPQNGLTLFWASEGLLLFLAGLVARHQAARLLGLGLLCFCVLKLFIYDLRGLETLARIISFIGLGLILLAVSFLYTKYSALVRRYL